MALYTRLDKRVGTAAAVSERNEKKRVAGNTRMTIMVN